MTSSTPNRSGIAQLHIIPHCGEPYLRARVTFAFAAAFAFAGGALFAFLAAAFAFLAAAFAIAAKFVFVGGAFSAADFTVAVGGAHFHFEFGATAFPPAFDVAPILHLVPLMSLLSVSRPHRSNFNVVCSSWGQRMFSAIMDAQ